MKLISYQFIISKSIKYINKIIGKLNSNKAAGPDCIPINVIKASANVIDSHLTCIINKDRKIQKQPPSACNFLKKRLWHRYFPVNFAKFLRTPFLQDTSGRLLLKVKKYSEDAKTALEGTT